MGVEGSNRNRKQAVDAASLDHGPNDTRNATLQMHPRGRCERIYRAKRACAFWPAPLSGDREVGRPTDHREDLTMDMGEWLRSIGLGQYEAAFRDNEIDDDVLRKLTADDLKDLGVTIVGHRRKIMTAIAELSASAGAPAATAGTEHLPPIVETAQTTAERRQLTVLFCDLAGSTAMSARLDPEDMRDVIRAYQDICSGVIARYDGYLAKFMGDGVLAYFGFPRAHEDDAERAVRAGLDLADAIAKVQTRDGEVLKTRIGVATGIVVVGDLIGQGSAQEQAVIGDTPNLAARLQARADPGGVLIADQTRRLLGNAFELKSLDLQDLKGLDASVRAWAVLREAETETRFEASQSSRMTPFVGREPEVALLIERWRDACSGEGKVALLSGEAGIGKSRILATLRERIANEPHLAIRKVLFFGPLRMRFFTAPREPVSIETRTASPRWRLASKAGRRPALYFTSRLGRPISQRPRFTLAISIVRRKLWRMGSRPRRGMAMPSRSRI
jgi:class 3 adenylate cyclase